MKKYIFCLLLAFYTLLPASTEIIFDSHQYSHEKQSGFAKFSTIALKTCPPLGFIFGVGYIIYCAIKGKKEKPLEISRPVAQPDLTISNNNINLLSNIGSNAYSYSGPSPQEIRLEQNLAHNNQAIVELQCEYNSDTLLPEILTHEIFNNRKAVLAEYTKNQSPVTNKYYSLAMNVKTKLAQYKRNLSVYENMLGCQAQHVLHQECLTIIERTLQTHKDVQYSSLEHSLMDMVEAGRVHNQAGNIAVSSKLVDAAWALLRVCFAVSEGLDAGVTACQQSVGNLIMHPIETLTTTATSIVHAGHFLLRCTLECADLVELIYYPRPETIVRGLKLADQINTLGQQLTIYCQRHPYKTITDATACITEGALNACLFNTFGNMCNSAARNAPAFVTTMSEGLISALTAEEAQVALIGNMIYMGEETCASLATEQIVPTTLKNLPLAQRTQEIGKLKKSLLSVARAQEQMQLKILCI